MFGVSRKKNKPSTTRIRATSSSDDDDEDDGARLRLQKHQELRKANKIKKKKGDKKKKNAPMLSFDPEEVGGDDDENGGFGSSSKKSKKRKKHSSKHGKSKKSSRGGGLGYGGLGVMAVDASDDSASDGDNNNNKEDVGGSYYGADALEKLKKEQKRTVLTKEDDTADKGVGPENEKPAADENESKAVRKERANENGGHDEEEFISLSGGTKTSKRLDPVVLTGDEALAYAQRDEDENNATMDFDHGLQSPPTPPPQHEKSMSNKVAEMDMNNNVSDKMDIDNEPPSEEVEEGTRRWEDTMARRAGVLPPDAARTGNGNIQQQSRPRQSHEQNRSSSSLSQMRASLQPTIANLSNINSDLESSIHRHQSSLSSTHEDLTKHRTTLQKHGQALEYYQGLREDLATWMGALRELNGMIEKVELAKGKIEHEMTCTKMEQFWEWGNDCTEVLERQGLLKTKVVGDGIDNNAIVEQIRQVDEFGRDLSSMSSMARVKRWNQRRKQCAKRMQQDHDGNNSKNPLQQRMECSNEDNIVPAEFDEWESRYDALQQAIGIIPNLVDDSYLSITNLCTLFNDWEQLYPDDYKNCYAELSLVQMISVLVRLELCQKSDVLGLYHTLPSSSSGGCLDVTEFKWFGDLQKFNAQREATHAGEVDKVTDQTEPRKSVLLEVVQKQVINHFMDTLSIQDGNEHGAYDPSSTTQTKQMCSTLKSILRYLSNHNDRDVCTETLDKVIDALLLSLKHYIGKITVPVVDASKVSVIQDDFVARDGAKDFDDEASDAIAYATLIQAKELCKLVKIVLEHWYPTINQELHNTQKEGVSSLVKFVYEDLINSRILPTLQSLRDISSGSNAQGEKYSEMPKVLISDIMDALQGADLLEKDEWMLIAAPLRVASRQLG